MFKRRTLFIVGAGASNEFGLPLGSKLAAAIREKLDVSFDSMGFQLGGGDRELWGQVHRAFAQLNEGGCMANSGRRAFIEFYR
jgi:hypothetical protein